MNLEELENNWREYALIGIKGMDFEMLVLADVFKGCEKSHEGLVFFLMFGICHYWDLKCDEDGSCWRRISPEDSWLKFGKLVPVRELRRNDLKRLRRLGI